MPVEDTDAGLVSAAAELVTALVEDAGGTRPLAGPAAAGQTHTIPKGTFTSGSAPGDEGREPGVEPALADVALDEFSIDGLPFPNDPSAAPRLVATPEEASRLCDERGARLCTELEWERACKGPDGDRFATGASWNEACEHAPSRCGSGFGVRAMGFLPEWTDSRFAGARAVPVPAEGRPGMGRSPIEEAVVRGGPGEARRCAARSRVSRRAGDVRSTRSSPPFAFRCCRGDRNEATIAPIQIKAAFRDPKLDASDLARIFASVPELVRISEGVRLFTEDDVESVVARSRAASNGIVFTTSPLVWSPAPGVELLIATGRSSPMSGGRTDGGAKGGAKPSGFIVALWSLANGRYRFASSFLLLGDASPIALAYEPSRRKELRWSTCWNCRGEQGAVSLREDGRVVVVQY